MGSDRALSMAEGWYELLRRLPVDAPVELLMAMATAYHQGISIASILICEAGETGRGEPAFEEVADTLLEGLQSFGAVLQADVRARYGVDNAYVIALSPVSPAKKN